MTRPGHPEDNGGHEQMHRVFKAETTHPVASTRQGQQHRTTGWVNYYNRIRPHQALSQELPVQWYGRRRRPQSSRKAQLRYPNTWPQRHVRSNGQIKWRGRKRFIGEAFVGRRLGLKPLKSGVHAVYFGPLLIGHLHDADAGGMRPVVYHHSTDPLPKRKV
jgi:putative transposase